MVIIFNFYSMESRNIYTAGNTKKKVNQLNAGFDRFMFLSKPEFQFNCIHSVNMPRKVSKIIHKTNIIAFSFFIKSNFQYTHFFTFFLHPNTLFIVHQPVIHVFFIFVF